MGRHNQFSAENSNIDPTQGMRDYLVADKLNVFIVGPFSLHITLTIIKHYLLHCTKTAWYFCYSRTVLSTGQKPGNMP